MLSTLSILGILSAFYPTTRKSWKHPRLELAAAHLISSSKHITSIMARLQVTIATAVFPTAICTMNLVMLGILLSRRYFLYGSFKNKEKATAEQLP